MTNIKNNNYRKIDCRLIDDMYMDFMISKDEIINNDINNDCFATILDFCNVKNNRIVSNISWKEASKSDELLENIGYTGVDNGFISYEKDRISNEEFLNIYTKSSFDLSTYGDKFFMTRVKGNTETYVYDVENFDNYTALKGGFYQGFFKINGNKYQTLPHKINSEWNFNFTLRCKDYDINNKSLNNYHTNNNGIFFYIGTRAENKFWELYKSTDKMNEYKSNVAVEPNITQCDYYNDIHNQPSCDNAFIDDYLLDDIDISKIELKDSKGNIIGEKGFYEIETDNKFITFNRTKEGFNTKTWDDNYTVILKDKKDSPNINYFPYLNMCKNGYTKQTIEELNNEYNYTYNIFQDIENNAFSLKINDDGSIGYRYLSNDCKIIEETSVAGIIKKDEWTNIHLKIVKKGNVSDVCDENTQGIMQLYIYVNGYLKLISQELPELSLKSLNDTSERQEGVPYNISIGGGSQGLSERIFVNYYDISDYILPIEKYFAGTFIGDIKEFNFIPCEVDLNFIKNKAKETTAF